MKFLLVSLSPVVKKIFDIALRKIGVFDFVDSIENIPLEQDYSYIFIDSEVLNTSNLQDIRSRIPNTRLCLIIPKDFDKDVEVINGFDSYIKKPFLPENILKIINQVNNSDLDSSVIQHTNNNNKVDDVNSYIVNNIDLSEFSDSDDEFLSGVKDNTPISNPKEDSRDTMKNSYIDQNDEIKFTYDDSLDNKLDNDNQVQVPIDLNPINEVANIEIKNNANISNNSTMKINRNDDIDFSSIFALQDEFLKNKNKEKPKGIIGGDIYTTKTQDDTKLQLNNTIKEDIPSSQETNTDILKEVAVEEPIISKDTALEQESSEYNFNFDDDLPAESMQLENEQNNDLVADFDNEELLRLQEEEQVQTIQDLESPEPKILNKNDIDELTNILEDTENINNDFDDELSTLDGSLVSDVLEQTNESLEEPVLNQVETSSINPSLANTTSNVSINPNIDLTEVIKAFPVDKLRELLSGVQITINITFPTKK